MTLVKKIPLWAVILINVNLVVGSAFFLCSPAIAASLGVFSSLAWIGIGLLMYPLLAAFADLSRKWPNAGGIYTYCKEALGTWWGFLCGWTYFVGTAAGNAMVLLALIKILETFGIFPDFLAQSAVAKMIFTVACVVISIVACLFNTEVMETIQLVLTGLKIIPFLILAMSLIPLFDWSNLTAIPVDLHLAVKDLPFILFGYIGLEACTAIAGSVEDGENNIARAIMISFSVIMLTYSFFQFCLIAATGSKILTVTNFAQALNEIILPQLFSSPITVAVFALLIKSCIAISYLGGYYNAFFSNNWVLYAMTKDGCFGNSGITASKLNRFGAPSLFVYIQGLIVATFCIFSTGILTFADLGILIGYLLSVAAFIKAFPFKKLTGVLALGGCAILVLLVSVDIAEQGLLSLIPFALVTITGLMVYAMTETIETT